LLELPDPGRGPAEEAVARSTTTLAFLCAVQLLPPLQRAVLILRDVLDFSAKEVAQVLDSTPSAVHSALQRARKRLDLDVRAQPPFASRPVAPDEDLLVRRFMRAWEAADIAGLVELLAQDATLAMPPAPIWFRGRAAIGEFLATVPAEGRLDLIPLVRTRANGGPAVAAYMPAEGSGGPEAYGIMVLTIRNGAITGITGFADPSLFPIFALPGVHAPS
jgi:RNA polymerase sigma-70 factor (ECF subfamily)